METNIFHDGFLKLVRYGPDNFQLICNDEYYQDTSRKELRDLVSGVLDFLVQDLTVSVNEGVKKFEEDRSLAESVAVSSAESLKDPKNPSGAGGVLNLFKDYLNHKGA
jgi:hypothetical protein